MQLAREREGQLLHPLPEGDQRCGRVLAALLRLLPSPAAARERLDHRPVTTLQSVQPGQRVPHRELFRVAGVDTGDEGVGHVVQHFLIEAPPHEPRDALLHRRVALLHQRLAEHRELGAVGQEPGREDFGGDIGRGTSLFLRTTKRFRAAGDAGTTLDVRPILSSERLNRGRRRGEGVGAQVGQVAIRPLGDDLAAGRSPPRTRRRGCRAA